MFVVAVQPLFQVLQVDIKKAICCDLHGSIAAQLPLAVADPAFLAGSSRGSLQLWPCLAPRSPLSHATITESPVRLSLNGSVPSSNGYNLILQIYLLGSIFNHYWIMIGSFLDGRNVRDDITPS